MITDLDQNLKKVLEKIEIAKKKSPYNQDVKVVCVSKYVGSDKVKEVYDLGIRDFGENRPQELVKKYGELGNLTNISFHQIGTLQKNKVKYIIDKAALIHSLDSFSLAEKINTEAKKNGIIANCLIQINISLEENKHGISKEDVKDFIKKTDELDNVKVIGLMGMAPFEEDVEKTRPYFKDMRQIFEDINSGRINKYKLTELSMGMSNDFEIAIEEGATIVRIGTMIFGGR